MAMYPRVQKKAQAEIDAVVGFSRLPDFGDRSSLPFINAVVKESMRWQSIIPLGKPLYSLLYCLFIAPYYSFRPYGFGG